MNANMSALILATECFEAPPWSGAPVAGRMPMIALSVCGPKTGHWSRSGISTAPRPLERFEWDSNEDETVRCSPRPGLNLEPRRRHPWE